MTWDEYDKEMKMKNSKMTSNCILTVKQLKVEVVKVVSMKDKSLKYKSKSCQKSLFSIF